MTFLAYSNTSFAGAGGRFLVCMTLSRLLSVFGGGQAASLGISPHATSPHVSPCSSRNSSFTSQQRALSVTSRALPTAPWLSANTTSLQHASQTFALRAHVEDHITTLYTPTTSDHLEADAPNTYTVACPQPAGLAGSSLRPGPSTSRQALPAPLASLTRVLLTSQPTSLLRTFGLRRQGRLHGPASVLLTLFAIFAAVAAALRSWMIQKVKRCRSCRGYGVMRCRVCDGVGKVEWQAKFGHTTCCPLCFSKRLMTCLDCGGLYHKPLFQHARCGARDPVSVQDVYENDLS